MGAIREFNFINGPETPVFPTSPDPSVDKDLVTLGFANANFAPAGAISRFITIEILADGVNPALEMEPLFDLNRFEFPAGIDSDMILTFGLKGYTPGNHIKLFMYGNGTTDGDIVMETVASLYRPGTTDNSIVPPNRRTNPQTIALPATPDEEFTDTSLELSDSSGEINSVALATTDRITVNMKRKGTDGSDTAVGSFILTHLLVDLNG